MQIRKQHVGILKVKLYIVYYTFLRRKSKDVDVLGADAKLARGVGGRFMWVFDGGGEFMGFCVANFF